MRKIKTKKIIEVSEKGKTLRVTITKDSFDTSRCCPYVYLGFALKGVKEHKGCVGIKLIGDNDSLFEELVSLIDDWGFSFGIIKKVYVRFCIDKTISDRLELFGFDQEPFEEFFNCREHIFRHRRRVTLKNC